MLEQNGDMWAVASAIGADVIVITTNGAVRKDGKAVMGAGCAKEAVTHYPTVQLQLGASLIKGGNHCHRLPQGDGVWLVSMPVKHHWSERADLDLISRSARELDAMATVYGWERIVMPRPGCGNGQLTWALVKPIIEWLDDRFVVMDYGVGTRA